MTIEPEYVASRIDVFAMVPEWVFAHPVVRSGSVLQTYIAMYLDGNFTSKRTTPDWRSIADRTGLSRATIFANISAMVEAEPAVLVKEGRGRYYLPPIPPKSEISDSSPDPSSASKSEYSDLKSKSESKSSETPLLTELQKENILVNASVDQISNPNSLSSPEGWEAIWEIYPRKGDAARALECYTSLISAGEEPDTLLMATKVYLATRVGDQAKYTLNLENFFGLKEEWRRYVDPPTGTRLTDEAKSILRKRDAEEYERKLQRDHELAANVNSHAHAAALRRALMPEVKTNSPAVS